MAACWRSVDLCTTEYPENSRVSFCISSSIDQYYIIDHAIPDEIKKMKTLHYSIIIITEVILSLVFFHAPTASAHLIPSFSVQPDQNYTDPVTHYLNTKEGHLHIVIIRDSEFTLPMTLKSENDSKTTSYFIHVTDGNNFTAETMPPGVSIRVLPNHFITSNGTDQKFNIVIKVDKNAPSGVYAPNLVI